MANTNKLFEPVKLGNTVLNNRVGVAPMTRISATFEGLATDQMVSYYTSFAQGGFGLIITEGNYIDDKYSQTYPHQPGIVYDEQVEGWKKVVDSVHQAGAKIFMQLQHSGALSQGNRFAGETIAPSAVQPKGEQLAMYLGEGQFQTPREAAKEEIQEVIISFVHAAKHAQSVGFDGIELHGANGYLLDGFLTDYTNQRKDEYGGSTENRVRLSSEIAKAIREAVGDEFTIGIRISQAKVNDFSHKWAGKEQDAEIIFGQLGKANVDYIHVTEHKAWEPAFDTNGPSLASLAKKYGNVPVIANGHLEGPEKAAEIIESGEAEVVTLGKGALANHDWVSKVKNGTPLAAFDSEKVLNPDARIKEFEA
ncbi:NADH:flavin oxidoreductase [Lentibacillus sediminis]|uniref:oxidoreductase n=1 Tax=Lentibacillus sediminis TaxID=1940529 RepID=UPI000C1C3FF5|nr:NADH:flavin oxidoreductase [Lentibacillus sediminis]